MRKIVRAGNSGGMETRIHPHSPDTTEDQPNSDGNDPASQPDDALIAAIRRSEARSREALFEQLGLISEAELRGIAENSGARSTQAWLRELLNLSDGDSKSRVVVARSTTRNNDLPGTTNEPELPATANILHSGEPPSSTDESSPTGSHNSRPPSAPHNAPKPTPCSPTTPARPPPDYCAPSPTTSGTGGTKTGPSKRSSTSSNTANCTSPPPATEQHGSTGA